ncbi:hypothetical protein F4780DRAFT_749447, partial [Xylariomycetidae sp. FL0641]
MRMKRQQKSKDKRPKLTPKRQVLPSRTNFAASSIFYSVAVLPSRTVPTSPRLLNPLTSLRLLCLVRNIRSILLGPGWAGLGRAVAGRRRLAQLTRAKEISPLSPYKHDPDCLLQMTSLVGFNGLVVHRQGAGTVLDTICKNVNHSPTNRGRRC